MALADSHQAAKYMERQEVEAAAAPAAEGPARRGPKSYDTEANSEAQLVLFGKTYALVFYERGCTASFAFDASREHPLWARGCFPHPALFEEFAHVLETRACIRPCTGERFD